MSFSQRHLPHLHAVGQPLFVTFRLHGSLPSDRKFSPETVTSGKAFVCMDRLLDSQSTGPLYLKIPAVAQLVVNAIEKGASSDYILHAWVIMANHVHLLITPQLEFPLIMRRLKGSTAREANKLLGLTGASWQAESYDRLVRNSEEFGRIENYIVQNPVRAGLAGSPDEYPWSSVSKQGGLKPAAG